ncbi:hypothetical protein BN135_1051 [Cronobacter muytjensii 530]
MISSLINNLTWLFLAGFVVVKGYKFIPIKKLRILSIKAM